MFVFLFFRTLFGLHGFLKALVCPERKQVCQFGAGSQQEEPGVDENSEHSKCCKPNPIRTDQHSCRLRVECGDEIIAETGRFRHFMREETCVGTKYQKTM